jgi:hypothetical protein
VELRVSGAVFGAGGFPSSWATLSQLTILDVSSTCNPMNTTLRALPPSWCNMTALTQLHANSSCLEGDVLMRLEPACMPNLQVLQLGDNRALSGGLPESECACACSL